VITVILNYTQKCASQEKENRILIITIYRGERGERSYAKEEGKIIGFAVRFLY